MNVLSQGLADYWKKTWSRKVRLVLAAAVAVGLFAVSSYYLYDGVNKRLVVYTLLCMGTGAFIVLPRLERWYLICPIILLYLVLVPKRLFERMELPIHNMARIREGTLLPNILIILLVYAVFLLISQQMRFALGGGSLALLILFLINYYVHLFRGSSLTFNDLLAVGTAMTVLDNYRLTMSSELWYSILYFCFFISLGFWCGNPIKRKSVRHLAVTAAALSYGLFFYCFWNVSGYLEEHGIQGYYWNISENQLLNGFLLSFGINMRELSMEKPRGYSEKELSNIAQQAENTYQAPASLDGRRSNIILIMNEAWSDLRVLGNLETSKPFMPFTDSLMDNVAKGNIIVEILGGLTANTEFEVLTGDSLAFLAPAAIPYQLQVNHDMYSLARVLGDQGYQTMAMHPSTGTAWKRDTVYDYFGFEEFIDVFQFETEYLYVGNFLSDECNFNEIIWRYEHKRKDTPLFLFDVTIQNHADYYGNTEIILHIDKVGDTPAQEAGYLYSADTYLNLMKVTDDAFKDLVEYFQGVEEPTIICMFGDHQPSLHNDFYSAVFGGSGLSEEEQRALKYITPYVIWANYEAELPEYGDISANYLGAAVLECAGVGLPPYYKFLLQLLRQYPEISWRTIDGLKEEEPVIQYKMLQYNHLMEKNYRRELFSAAQ